MKIPVRPPKPEELLAGPAAIEKLLKLIVNRNFGPTPGGKYRHWDTLRYWRAPTGETPEEVWLAVKFARRSLYERIPLTDTRGNSFQFGVPRIALDLLHQVDRDASGSIRAPSLVSDPATRDTYLFKSLVEEAITSSQLEGASTTRKVAKAMIREGRRPVTKSEQMIYNNYQAMLFVREHAHDDLTPEIVLELQRIVTDKTLDDPSAAGRLRNDDEVIHVTDEIGTLLHEPPPAAELGQRLEMMCRFANGHAESEFMHPVIRAIVLHFWLAYDHPFVDGNGRTARALFYWAMARHGYWLVEYVSISRILKKNRVSYAKAFLYTETDDNDLTYFMLHQLRVLIAAIRQLHEYLAKRAIEMRETEDIIKRLRIHADINVRQLALLNHALKDLGAAYSVESHRRSNGVSYETARADLLGLERAGLLQKSKHGKAYRFTAPYDLRRRLAAAKERYSPRAV